MSESENGCFHSTESTNDRIGSAKPKLSIKRRICSATIRVRPEDISRHSCGCARDQQRLCVDLKPGVVRIR